MIHEVVNYAEHLPFRIHSITRKEIMDGYGRRKDVLEHWHRELEIVYTFVGHAEHYIDGKVYRADSGSLFVTNSESIHKIVSDINIDENVDTVAIVLIINPEFVEQLIPNIKEMYFRTDVHSENEKIDKIMREFLEYSDHRKSMEPYEEVKLLGLMYELMYLICKDALASRKEAFPINNEKNMERLRGIMLYVMHIIWNQFNNKESQKNFILPENISHDFFEKILE